MRAPIPAREPPPWQACLGEALAESLPRLLAEPAEPLVQEVIAALTAALCRGELSLSLAGEAPQEVRAAHWPEGHRRALQASRLSRDPDGPLVLQGDRLLWRRWQQRHQAVVAALLERAALPAAGIEPIPPRLLAVAPAAAEAAEAAASAAAPVAAEGAAAARGAAAENHSMLRGRAAGFDPIQRQAVQAALERRLVLLLGGPGTGKTSTVAQLLEAWLQRHPSGRVQLTAPTGKAAARLRDATGGRVPCTTLHRLLESNGERFGRHRHNPLSLDLLVIDEVSMLDLELMEALLAALPQPCGLVLVGDPAQLPPIAPGSLLHALLEPGAADVLAPVCFALRTTYRNDGAIARVAAALRQQIGVGQAAAADRPPGALAPLRPLLAGLGPADNLQWLESPLARCRRLCCNACVSSSAGWRPWRSGAGPVRRRAGGSCWLSAIACWCSLRSAAVAGASRPSTGPCCPLAALRPPAGPRAPRCSAAATCLPWIWPMVISASWWSAGLMQRCSAASCSAISNPTGAIPPSWPVLWSPPWP